MGKNSLEMKSCKKDSEELVVWLFYLVFFHSVLMLKIIQNSANPCKYSFVPSSIYRNAGLFAHGDSTACWTVGLIGKQRQSRRNVKSCSRTSLLQCHKGTPASPQTCALIRHLQGCLREANTTFLCGEVGWGGAV